MIHLNPTQEKHLIRYMIDNDDLFMAAGAARAVFSCTTDVADYLGLSKKDANAYDESTAKGFCGNLST